MLELVISSQGRPWKCKACQWSLTSSPVALCDPQPTLEHRYQSPRPEVGTTCWRSPALQLLNDEACNDYILRKRPWCQGPEALSVHHPSSVRRQRGAAKCKFRWMFLCCWMRKYLEVGKPLFHPEADRPHAHAVGEQAVPHNVPPHQPLALLLHQDNMRIGTRTDMRTTRTFPIRNPLTYIARVSGHGRRLYWFHHLNKSELVNSSNKIIKRTGYSDKCCCQNINSTSPCDN